MVTKVMGLMLSLIGLIIKPLPFPPEFVSKIDGAIAFFIDLLSAASWVIPLDVLIVCLSVVFLVDNYEMFVRFVKWLISLIPGVG